jgi:large subunit ribosomal protein L6
LQRSLYFFLGYNHVTKYKFANLVDFRPLKGHVLIFSVQKALFGSAIYQLRHLRYPDPYRGKGIRYRFQLMKFKPGKQR